MASDNMVAIFRASDTTSLFHIDANAFMSIGESLKLYQVIQVTPERARLLATLEDWAWLNLAESTLAQEWGRPEDDVYDSL